MMLTCAVVSDVHCHPSSERAETCQFSDALRIPTGAHPVASLLKTIKEHNLTAEILLAPGDITNKMNQQGLISGWQLIKEIAAALSVSHLYATPGNHEIWRGADDPLKAAKSLDPSAYPVAIPELSTRFWGQGFCVCITPNYRILLINSVTFHNTEKEIKRGKMDETMLEKIEMELKETDPARFQIATVHHHPMPHEGLGLGAEDLLIQGSELLRLLEKHGFQLVVHGHKHHPRLSYAQGGSSSPAVLAAGSFSALGKMLTNTRNLFHIVELSDEEHPNCSGPGLVRSWQYSYLKGWDIPAEESSDLPPIAGFGFRGDPMELARETERVIGQRQLLPWDELLKRIPAAQFMLPYDMDRYAEALKTKGLEIYRARPASRRVIGRAI